MSLIDADRWNLRYATNSRQTFASARTWLTSHVDVLPKTGLGLDIAMGLGGNGGFLLSQGLKVVGVDIAEVAVRKALKSHPGLMVFVADLTRVEFPVEIFDVVCNFFYLDRSLWPHIQRWMKPGGLLFYETLLEDQHAINPGLNPAHLLAKGELVSAFPGLRIIEYVEGWYGEAHPRSTARLIARKPAN